ncbi:unnamed protein product [Bursaphelenchus okinawaensis]|uniref:Uncharacterized protein n=1 Tax=Bursaphelenchus okinawaensis TaxID=465554 RepID=A0A811LJC6_9BILA|nr:unnamed protein product [Bursaphelenchus okinawaensis]CAG9123399.1 unnamed protein product [Bursaphelenchus okinawaensis]
MPSPKPLKSPKRRRRTVIDDTKASQKNSSSPQEDDTPLPELTPPISDSERNEKLARAESYDQSMLPPPDKESEFVNPHLKYEHAIASKNFEPGETLANISAGEWERADPAYKPEMINEKMKENKISVFQASQTNVVEGNSTVLKAKGSSKRKKASPSPAPDKAALIGQMVTKVIREYLKGKNEDRIRLEIRLVDEDDVPFELATAVRKDAKPMDERGGVVTKKSPNNKGWHS